MDFQLTSLPDGQIFREAFAAGWARYLTRFAHTDLAAEQYIRGPVAMARLIYEHGGPEHEIAAAACLAGPAVFSDSPDDWLDQRMVEFSREFQVIGQSSPGELYGKVSALSSDARLLLQASAIMLLEQLVTAPEDSAEECMKIYTDSLELYSAARGPVDNYKLDTKFEIAAMKVTTVIEGQAHLWSRPRVMTARVHA